MQGGNRPPALLAVRGEVFMLKQGFHELNTERMQKGLEPFANPRNATAGLIRQLDSKEAAGKPLDARFYDVLHMEGSLPECHVEVLEQFERWGLKTDTFNAECSSLQQIEERYDALVDQREKLAYEVDGLVIKVAHLQLRESLGVRQRSPRWALAWKFPPRQEVSRITDIVVQVGRTGKLTPVALLEPVDVGGVTISRASLHNEDEIHRKDVRVGDTVKVARAGDVIPEVQSRVAAPEDHREGAFKMPSTCPACGGEVSREGAYHVCRNGLSCPPQLIGRIVHYASREALDIRGLSEQTSRQLVEKGLVRNLADLYRLTKDNLASLEGFAHKSAMQLHEAIHQSRKPSLDRFVYSLGIPHVGKHAAQVLADYFPSMERLSCARQDELRSVPGIGDEIATSVEGFFRDEQNRSILRELLGAGISIQEPPVQKQDRPLRGKTFVFTGSLERHTRSEVEQAVERLGGRTSSSVSSNTDFVVVGENPGRKLDEAKEQGVRIIEEAELESMLK